MADLTSMTCKPCQHWVPPLTDDQIEEFKKDISLDWEVVDSSKLVREITVKDFLAGVSLIEKIAEVAEKQNHHPNICLHDYKQVSIELYTHKINGLHQNDFILAAKIDQIL